MNEAPRRRRLARILAALAALLLLGTFAPLGLFSVPEPVRAATIRFEPLALDPDRPERRRVGGLFYLEGWRLESGNPRFGGISGIHVEAGRVVAITDAGTLIRFALPRAGLVADGSIDMLPDAPGSPSIKSDRDSESLAVAGDRAWIGFERRDEVWRYRTSDWRSDAHHAPAAMRGWPNNAGAEGIVRFADGRFLIFSEGARAPGGASKAVLFEGDPALAETRALTLAYRAPSGYRLTDAALLPDGRLLLLNRRFTLLDGISAKLVAARLPERIEEGAVIEGEEIAHLASPLQIDNMEALSVSHERGRTIVWIASDDNFNPLQRTLLLKFALD